MSAVSALRSETASSVEAELTYYERISGRAVVYQGAPGRESRRTGEFDRRRVTIDDARVLADELSLDTQGFELQPWPTEVTDFYDDEEVSGVYYPEVERLLRSRTGATRVHIFDHTVRVEDTGKRKASLRRAPVRMVHNDYTERSGPQRVMDLIPAPETETWLASRFAIVNVWRSIAGPVRTEPLALADARSLAREDFILTDLVYPDRVGEIYYVAYNPAHRWYYVPEATREETLLIKSYDSAQDGRARFTPHSAFEHPQAVAHPRERESIEVRALLSFA